MLRSVTLPGGKMLEMSPVFLTLMRPPGVVLVKVPVGRRVESSLRVVVPQQTGCSLEGREGRPLVVE